MLKSPGKILRELLAGKEIVIAPGAYDGISARAIEQAGYKAAFMTGAGVSASVIGHPDLGLMTMTEMLTSARNISSSISIPLIADADTGYGNPLNVIRTIHEYEAAGVGAVQLEDQVFPKRCGHLAGKDVISADEFIAKLNAAVNERYDKDLVIVARTDARAIEGLDKAIDRCKRYIDAGADVIFFEATQSIDEIETVGRCLGSSIPLLSNQVPGGRTPAITAKDLEQMGYKIVIYPSVCMSPALFAMQKALKFLKEEETLTIDINGGNGLDLMKTVGIEDWLELEKKYVTK